MNISPILLIANYPINKGINKKAKFRSKSGSKYLFFSFPFRSLLISILCSLSGSVRKTFLRIPSYLIRHYSDTVQWVIPSNNEAHPIRPLSSPHRASWLLPSITSSGCERAHCISYTYILIPEGKFKDERLARIPSVIRDAHLLLSSDYSIPIVYLYL